MTGWLEQPSVTVSLQPTEDESLDKILASPNGTGASGLSDRQAAVERAVSSLIRPRLSAPDNPTQYSGSAWQAPAGDGYQ